jgi:RNA polymerase sigma factor
VALTLVRGARAGDADARDTLLRDFMPFVLRVASQQTGRYLRTGVDEEISVALMAFNQAIDGYQEGRGSFAGFAETVIRRRLIDYRRRQKLGREVVLSDLEVLDDEGHLETPTLDRVARDAWSADQEAAERRQEIFEYRETLARFGIEFRDLTRNCPKHRDARARATAVARRVAEDRDLAEHLLAERNLPLRDLLPRVEESRKTVERHRRYIVAVALILLRRNEWPHLASYITEEAGR